MELPMLSASQCDHTQKAGESNALIWTILGSYDCLSVSF